VVCLWPKVLDEIGQVFWAFEAAAVDSICPPEVGIAKLTDRLGTILLPTTPQVTTGEAAKDRWSARLGSFPLQGIKSFLNLISHNHVFKTAKIGTLRAISFRNSLLNVVLIEKRK
jgi:hypothetical protein